MDGEQIRVLAEDMGEAAFGVYCAAFGHGNWHANGNTRWLCVDEETVYQIIVALNALRDAGLDICWVDSPAKKRLPTFDRESLKLAHLKGEGFNPIYRQ